MMCQCRLIDYNKSITLVGNVGSEAGCAFVRLGGIQDLPLKQTGTFFPWNTTQQKWQMKY